MTQATNPGRELSEGDLALLASRAAVQIDDILLGRPPTRGPIEQLADHLTARLQTVAPSCGATQLVDPATVVVVERAMRATGSSARTLEELVQLARAIAETMRPGSEPASTESRREGLVRARIFCVALSQAAMSSLPSIDEADITHPYGT